MNENLLRESTNRLPHQVTARADNARAILAAGPSEKPLAPGASRAAAPASATAFTVEELLKPPSPEKDSDPSYWKGRANMLEGFRRQDQARAQARIQALEQENGNLKGQLAQLKRPSPTPAPPPARSAADIAREEEARLREFLRQEFTEEEIEAFGDERALEIARKHYKRQQDLEASAAAARQEAEDLKSQKTKQETTQAEEAAVAQDRKFLEKLTELFPTWQIVDGDQRWHDWLGREDEVSGERRQEILVRHKNNPNIEVGARRLAKMIEAFIATLNAAHMPGKPHETPETVDGSGAQGSQPLEQMPEGVRILTETEMKAGYKRLSTLGKNRFSPEQEAVFRKSVELTMQTRGRG